MSQIHFRGARIDSFSRAANQPLDPAAEAELQAALDKLIQAGFAIPQQPTFYVGQRVKIHDGSRQDALGNPIPAGAIFQIDSIHGNGTLLGGHGAYKDSHGKAVTFSASVPATAVELGRGRLMMPGEKPPKRGQSFGLTGKNNGRKGAKAPSVAAQVAQVTPAPTVTVSGSPRYIWSDVQSVPTVVLSNVGTPCPAGPSCNGTLRLVQGTSKRTGRPYALVACDRRGCDVVILQDGTPGGRKALVPSYGTAPVAPVAAPAPVAVPNFPAPTIQNAPAPVVPEVPAEIPVAVEVPTAPAVPTGYVFPLVQAQKLAADVRKMQDNGASVTFSLRKLMTWARVAAQYAAKGTEGAAATALGFRHAVLDREIGEQRKALASLYQSYFGAYPESVGTAPDLPNIVQMFVSGETPLFIHGPTGCGKSHAIMQALNAMGRPFIRYVGSKYATLDELAGGPGLVNGNTVEQDGLIAVAAKTGQVLFIDELDKLPDAVLSELTAILENVSSSGAYHNRRTGEVIRPVSGFGIMAAGNSSGQGEAAQYVGTMAMNEALRDRFAFFGASYMEPKQEAAILADLAAANGFAVDTPAPKSRSRKGGAA